MNNYLVFDVGGTKVKYAVISENGEFISKGDFPSDHHDFRKFRSKIIKIALDFKKNYNISGIAFSCPGAVDSESGFIGGSSGLPCIHGPNFKKVFGNATGLPIELENDANCAALGEVWKGAAKTNQNILFVIIGTGIGGAVVIDRKIHKGANLHGGEFGYMTLNVVTKNGKPTFRTWTGLSSTSELVSRVATLKGEAPAEWNGKMVFEAAEKGDNDSLKEIENFYLNLAQGIFNLQYIYDPEKIILGGAISSRDDLIEQIYKKLDIILDSIKIAKVRPVIESCKYKNDANLLGALFHFLQRQNKVSDKTYKHRFVKNKKSFNLLSFYRYWEATLSFFFIKKSSK